MQYQDCAYEVQADEADSEKAYVYGPVPFGLELANANINAQTGLATDYLNHFNEAIMLLEMAGNGPDCIAELRRWQPMSYHEHFLESRLKARDLAIAAYAGADPDARASLDHLASTMTAVIETTRARLTDDLPPQAAADAARRASIWLKQLVARAGAVINGAIDLDQIDTPQAAIDRLMLRG